MFPPLMIATIGPSMRPCASTAPLSTAAMLAAPLGSATIFARLNAHSTASRIGLVADRHHAVGEPADVIEGQVARTDGHQPVGDLSGRGQRDGMPGSERGAHLGRALRLDADHFDGGPRLLDGRGDARGQPAAADRHDDRGHARALVEDLQPDRALARDDPFVVERRHHREPARHRLGLGARPPLRRGRALEDHLPRRSARAPSTFIARRRRRHDHHRRRAELCARRAPWPGRDCPRNR